MVQGRMENINSLSLLLPCDQDPEVVFVGRRPIKTNGAGDFLHETPLDALPQRQVPFLPLGMIGSGRYSSVSQSILFPAEGSSATSSVSSFDDLASYTPFGQRPSAENRQSASTDRTVSSTPQNSDLHRGSPLPQLWNHTDPSYDNALIVAASILNLGSSLTFKCVELYSAPYTIRILDKLKQQMCGECLRGTPIRQQPLLVASCQQCWHVFHLECLNGKRLLHPVTGTHQATPANVSVALVRLDEAIDSFAQPTVASSVERWPASTVFSNALSIEVNFLHIITSAVLAHFEQLDVHGSSIVSTDLPGFGTGSKAFRVLVCNPISPMSSTALVHTHGNGSVSDRDPFVNDPPYPLLAACCGRIEVILTLCDGKKFAWYDTYDLSNSVSTLEPQTALDVCIANPSQGFCVKFLLQLLPGAPGQDVTASAAQVAAGSQTRWAATDNGVADSGSVRSTSSSASFHSDTAHLPIGAAPHEPRPDHFENILHLQPYQVRLSSNAHNKAAVYPRTSPAWSGSELSDVMNSVSTDSLLQSCYLIRGLFVDVDSRIASNAVAVADSHPATRTNEDQLQALSRPSVPRLLLPVQSAPLDQSPQRLGSLAEPADSTAKTVSQLQAMSSQSQGPTSSSWNAYMVEQLPKPNIESASYLEQYQVYAATDHSYSPAAADSAYPAKHDGTLHPASTYHNPHVLPLSARSSDGSLNMEQQYSPYPAFSGNTTSQFGGDLRHQRPLQQHSDRQYARLQEPGNGKGRRGLTNRDFSAAQNFTSSDRPNRRHRGANHAEAINGPQSARSPAGVHLSVLQNTMGNIPDAAKTQSGSKYLQQQLAIGDPTITTYIVDRTEHDLPDIVVDMFGNYFVQALFKAANEAQRVRMLRSLSPAIADIACNRNGTYALQSIVDTTVHEAYEQIVAVKSGLSRDVLHTICNGHGTHVIQRFMKRFAPAQCDFIHVATRENVAQLVVHPNGVGVVLLCIDSADRATRTAILAYVIRNALTLSQHAYGNYAVQHLLGKKNRGLRVGSFPGLAEALCNVTAASSPCYAATADNASIFNTVYDNNVGGVISSQVVVQQCPFPAGQHPLFDETIDTIAALTLAVAICRCLRKSYATLSRLKYSSNVVEKCAVWGGIERTHLLRELFLESSIRELLKDSYANYVLQTALQSAHPQERKKLVSLIQPHLEVFASKDTPPAVQIKWATICSRLLASADAAPISDREREDDDTDGMFPDSLDSAHRGEFGLDQDDNIVYASEAGHAQSLSPMGASRQRHLSPPGGDSHHHLPENLYVDQHEYFQYARPRQHRNRSMTMAPSLSPQFAHEMFPHAIRNGEGANLINQSSALTSMHSFGSLHPVAEQGARSYDQPNPRIWNITGQHYTPSAIHS